MEDGPGISCMRALHYQYCCQHQANILTTERVPLFVLTFDAIHEGWLGSIVVLRLVSEGEIHKQLLHIYRKMFFYTPITSAGLWYVTDCGGLESHE